MEDKGWQEQLALNYPQIYGNVSIGTGPGWYKLLERLGKDISAVWPEKLAILQIKEKFGGLRFYVGWCSEPVQDLIDTAEEESYTICEWCGEVGSPKGSQGWIRTLCPQCRVKEAGGWRWWPNE
jgi:hypothetical protein